jgi:hypothetical protein
MTSIDVNEQVRRRELMRDMRDRPCVNVGNIQHDPRGASPLACRSGGDDKVYS